MPDGARTLDGRYELIEPLGRSPSRTTWRARRIEDGAEVAVKELLFHAMESWKTAELFEREIRVLRQLAHPAIPRLIDAFEAREGTRGGLYLVRELVRGRSLEEEMQARAHAPREVATIAAELLEIAADLHALSPPIVHRDLTLANVLRREGGALVAIDLGAVKDALTKGGSTIAGTYGFMAPEQLRGEACPASDVYAIGAIALSLIARRPIGELLDAHHRLRVEDHVPRGPMRRALLRMLAPSARSRPSAREAARRMRAIARGEDGARSVMIAAAAALTIGLVVTLAALVARPGDGADPAAPAIALAPPSAPNAAPPPPPRALPPTPPLALPPVPPPERRAPPELEGWRPRCAEEGCASVVESFAGIRLDDACAPLLPSEGAAPLRSERADRVALTLGTRRFECSVEQQHGAFCNVLCEVVSDRPWQLADELRAEIGDRHGAPHRADEDGGTSFPVAGIPDQHHGRRTWTWHEGDVFAPEVLLLAERTWDDTSERGRVAISYRGRFARRSGT